MVFDVVWYIGLTAAVAAFVAYGWFVVRLRDRHTDLWNELKRPDVIGFLYPWRSWPVLGFVWTSRARSIGDPALDIAIRLLRVFTLVTFVCFIVALFIDFGPFD